MRRTHGAAVLLLLGGLVIGLGGCAATGDPPDTGPAASPAQEANPDAAEQVSVEASDAAHCLNGSWLADNAYFLASLQEFGDAIETVTGRVTLTFSSDGTLTTEYADWLLTGTDDGATVTISRTGVDTGVYSIAQDTLTIEETDLGSTLIVTAAGAAMPIAPAPAVYHSAAFTCEETSASITTPDGTMQLTRE